MFLLLFLLFTVVPALELYLLVKIGQVIGPWETVLGVILMGVLGASLAKRAGFGLLAQIQQDLAQGLPPADRLIEGGLVLVGGVLMITPGVLSDVVGLAVMIPPVRRLLVRLIKAWALRRMAQGAFRVQGSGFSFSMGGPRPSQAAPPEPAEAEPSRRFDHPVL